MADDWEDEKWETAPAVLPTPSRSQRENDVPDDWDDEDADDSEEPVVAAAAPKPPALMKSSKRIANALKEKEAAQREAARERAMQREKELAEMDEASRKLEMQKIVEEADLDNARDLFMGTNAGGDSSRLPPAGDTLDTMMPKTEQDLSEYASMLTEKCRKFNLDPRRATRYVVFVKDVMRGLTMDLGADDAKEIATYMNTISNVKLEEFKKAKGGAKKKTSKKATVRVDRADSDMYGSYHDELDDAFM